MRQYTDLLRKILEKGRLKKNRTGVDVLSLIGPQMEFDLSDGFPLLTERPIFFRGVVGENLWFLDGECNNEALLAEGIKIWDKWALKEDRTARMARDLPELVEALFQKRNQDVPVGDEPVITRQQIQEELQAADSVDNQQGLPTLIDRKNATGPEEMMGGFRIMRDEGIELYADKLLLPKGYLGPIYGVLWRQWLTHDGRAVDQVQTIFDKLASDNPKLRYSRANIITAFNPGVLPDETVNAETNILNGKQALAACHTMFQLFAEPLTVEERINLVNASLPDWEHAREMLRKLNDPDSTPEAFTRTWFEALDADAQQKILDQLDELKVPKDRLSLKLYQRKHNCALAA